MEEEFITREERRQLLKEVKEMLEDIICYLYVSEFWLQLCMSSLLFLYRPGQSE